jgi:hypothetical protein
LADYLIVGTLHVLAVNSVQSLYNYYSEQLERTPSLEDIKATNKLPEKSESPEEMESPDHGDPKKEHSNLKKETSNVLPPQVFLEYGSHIGLIKIIMIIE